MTLGTGVGDSNGSSDNLAHALLFLIDSKNPDLVVFFGSSKSERTLESIKKQYLKEFDEEFDFYEFNKIEEIDSFDAYFNSIKDKIYELEDDYKIVLDYSSGTKTMTMSVAFASMVMGKQLYFISGKRENGLVISGTEQVISQNLYSVYDDIKMVQIAQNFNHYRFESALDILSTITSKKFEINTIEKFLKAYYYFDNVNYEKALDYYDISSFSKLPLDCQSFFNKNIKALNIINRKEHKLRCYYILASMLNNAWRRYEENRYDDAIARLYRSIELVCQIRLKLEHGIISSNIDLDSLKEHGLDEEYIASLNNLKDSSGKIKISLIQDFELLSRLDDPIGEYYNKNKQEIINILKYRNFSILAHGFESKTKEEFEEFNKCVMDVARLLTKDLDVYIDDTIFPTINI